MIFSLSVLSSVCSTSSLFVILLSLSACEYDMAFLTFEGCSLLQCIGIAFC